MLFWKLKFNFFLKMLFTAFFLASVLLVYLAHRNRFVSLVKDIQIPRIPVTIQTYLDSQIPRHFDECGVAAFKWFDYYDTSLLTKVKVKLSGYCSSHYNSLVNTSLRVTFGGNDLRLKSLASEVLMGDDPFTPFALVFSEYTNYKLSKDYTSSVPDAELVSLNGNRDDLRILWHDDLPNTVRELGMVRWKDIAKMLLYSEQYKDRIFSVFWKGRMENTPELDKKFINLIAPVVKSTTQDLDGSVKTDFDVTEYIRYLSIATLLGSDHISDHNLLYKAKEDNGGLTWSPVVYDFGSGRVPLDPVVSILPLNYLNEFFMRNPYFVFQYLNDVNYLNDSLFGTGKFGRFVDKFDCSATLAYPNFSGLLSKITQGGAAPKDINGYCASAERLKDFEKIAYLKLKNNISVSTLRWNVYSENGEPPQLIVWNPYVVPSKLVKINCGLFDCTNKFVLENEPWWGYHDSLIASRVVREVVDAGYTASITPYHYIYRWSGNGAFPNPETISIESVNAVSGEAIKPVRNPYPVLITESSRKVGSSSHKLSIQVFYPVTGEFSRDEQGGSYLKSGSGKGWSVEVLSKNCKKDSSFPDFSFDCGDLDASIWPYVLDYTVVLYRKESQIAVYRGEFFQEFKPDVEYEKIDRSTVENYRSKNPSYESWFFGVSRYLGNSSNELLGVPALKGKDFYYFPPGKKYEVTEDIDLEDSVVVFDRGSEFFVWPLVRISAGTLIAVSDPSLRTSFKKHPSLPGWYGFQVTRAAFMKDVDISDTLNVSQGALFGKDTTILKVMGTNFRNNLSNIHCENCNVDVSDSLFEGGKWAVKSSDSTVKVRDIDCFNLEYCFKVVDSKEDVSGVDVINIKAWVFRVEGQATDLKISNVEILDNTAGFLYTRYHPRVLLDDGTLNVSRAKVRHIDLDSENIYSELKGVDADDFYVRYKKYLIRDKTDERIFYFREKAPLVSEDVVVPEEVTLKFNRGTKVSFGKGVSILVYGKMFVYGAEARPVEFGSGDLRGRAWGSVVIKGEKSAGFIKNAVFSGGGGDYLVGFEYTGMLTADRSSGLEVLESSFLDSKNDDAVNCISTRCVIRKSVFKDNSMDAVDFDFALEGSLIEGNVFEDSGGDAIDLSFDGSIIYDNVVKGAKDKCISVGEMSEPLIFSNRLESCGISIQSKDSSTAYVINNDLINNGVAFSAYQKKKRFPEGGKILVYNSFLDGNKVTQQVEILSSIDIKEGKDPQIYGRFPFTSGKEIKYGLN